MDPDRRVGAAGRRGGLSRTADPDRDRAAEEAGHPYGVPTRRCGRVCPAARSRTDARAWGPAHLRPSQHGRRRLVVSHLVFTTGRPTPGTPPAAAPPELDRLR